MTTPLWMDMSTLCFNLCISERTVDAWCAQGILPPPRKRGGKLMWKWAEVDDLLANGQPNGSIDAKAEEIRNATRREVQNRY